MRRYYQGKSPAERYRLFCSGRDKERVRVADSEPVRRAKYPEAVAARKIVRNAISRGAIVRKPCEVCGAGRTEAHHDDYARPLDVRWLCVEHHVAVHYPYLAPASPP
jgi:hypothetical protein